MKCQGVSVRDHVMSGTVLPLAEAYPPGIVFYETACEECDLIILLDEENQYAHYTPVFTS